ncbi:uncharacterized protein LOC113474229 [Ciona intestinalis]
MASVLGRTNRLRDIVFFICFVLILCGLGYVTYTAVQNGNPARVFCSADPTLWMCDSVERQPTQAMNVSRVSKTVSYLYESLLSYWGRLVFQCVGVVLFSVAVILFMMYVPPFFNLAMTGFGIGNTFFSAVITCYLWNCYRKVYGINSDVTVATFRYRRMPDIGMFSSLFQTEPTLLLGFCIGCTILVMLFLVAVVLYIRQQKDIPEMSFNFINSRRLVLNIPGLLIEPLVTAVAILLVLMYFVYICACLFTAQSFGIFDELDGYFENPEMGRYILFAFLVFVCTWGVVFLYGCQQVVVGSLIARCNEGSRMGRFPTLWAVRQLLCYKLGTVAKGSLYSLIFTLPVMIIDSLLKIPAMKRNFFTPVKKLTAYSHSNTYVCVGLFNDPYMAGGRRAVYFDGAGNDGLARQWDIGAVAFAKIAAVIASVLVGIVFSWTSETKEELMEALYSIALVAVFAGVFASSYISSFQAVFYSSVLWASEDTIPFVDEDSKKAFGLVWLTKSLVKLDPRIVMSSARSLYRQITGHGNRVSPIMMMVDVESGEKRQEEDANAVFKCMEDVLNEVVARAIQEASCSSSSMPAPMDQVEFVDEKPAMKKKEPKMDTKDGQQQLQEALECFRKLFLPVDPTQLPERSQSAPPSGDGCMIVDETLGRSDSMPQLSKTVAIDIDEFDASAIDCNAAVLTV